MTKKEKSELRQHASNLLNQVILTLEKIEDEHRGTEEKGRALAEAAQTAIESQVHVDLCENCQSGLFGS